MSVRRRRLFPAGLRVSAAVVAAWVVPAFILACGGGGPTPPSTSVAPTATAVAPAAPTLTATEAASREPPSFDISAPPRFTLSEESLRVTRELATPEQLPMLEDGIITYAEYEQAAFDYVACLDGNGFHTIAVGPATAEGC